MKSTKKILKSRKKKYTEDKYRILKEAETKKTKAYDQINSRK